MNNGGKSEGRKGRNEKVGRKDGIVVTTLSQTGKSASNISRSHRPHTGLISRGHRPHTTLIQKMPSKGYEAMQVRLEQILLIH